MAAKKKAKKKTTTKAKKTTAKKTKKPAGRTMKARKPNAGFMKPMTPSTTLSTIVGGTPLPRTEVTKKLWAYIKRNNLQDQQEKRMIIADDKLKAVFGGKGRVSMFEMTKLVSKHLS
ncbi:MAG: SWIB/MDM2 domain-containing protein [Deltaproteobacteria bacterium]|nr:SWIB/MDM2 domain-containing protein [Deltaproteobacteria bacterium]